MSEIQKALRTLGLEPGSSKDAIQRRYKRLIMVWHPDRFPTSEGKADAEEELKKINNARDILFAHLDNGEHRTSDCECQHSTYAGATQSRGAENSTEHNTSGQEAQARRRDDERARRASQDREEHSRNQHEQNRSPEESAQSASETRRGPATANDSSLRWKIALAEIAVYFGIISFAWVAIGVRTSWHDFTSRWQNDHLAHQTTPPTDYSDKSIDTANEYPLYTERPQQNSSSTQQNDGAHGNTEPPPGFTIPAPATVAVDPSTTSMPAPSRMPPDSRWKLPADRPPAATNIPTTTSQDLDKP
jgi:curved DNA-binding protein CbpA